jgi:hypothetical protein
MYFIAAFIPVFCIALAAKRLLGRELWQTFPAALLSVVPIVYLCGLFGALGAGPYLILALGFAAFVCLLAGRLRRTRPQPSLRSLVTPDAALVLGGAVLIALLTAGRKVTDMDSFEQWAYIVKKMFLTDSLLSARGQYATTAAYPPGIALLQYYFSRFSPFFNEADLFRARDLLALALLLPFFRNLDWRRWKTLLLYVPLVFLLPYLESASFAASLEVDPMLGLLFAWLILASGDDAKPDWFTLLLLSLGSFALGMAKVSGVLFCLIAAVFLLLRVRAQTGGASAPRSRRLVSALAVAAAGLIGVLSWRAYVSASGAEIASSGLLSLRGGLLQYQKETIVNFLSALFAAEGGSGLNALSPAQWIVAVPAVSAVLVRLLSRDALVQKRSLVDSLLLTAGYFVWLLALLVGYLTSFVEGEALWRAGFSRYLSAYQLGGLIVCVHIGVRAADSREERPTRTLLLLLLCALLLISPLQSVCNATLTAPYANGKTADWRQRYAPSSRYYQQLDPAGVKICYLDQNPDEPGYSFALFQFEALPVDVEKAVAWRLGGPYYEEDYYSLSPSLEEWEQALLGGGFTHLYLRNTNAYFEQTYGSLFADPSEIAGDSYYKITRQGGHILFTKIQTGA